jgi:hypothetical protein
MSFYQILKSICSFPNSQHFSLSKIDVTDNPNQ